MAYIQVKTDAHVAVLTIERPKNESDAQKLIAALTQSGIVFQEVSA